VNYQKSSLPAILYLQLQKTLIVIAITMATVIKIKAQDYLPINGGTLAGNLGVGTGNSDQNLYLFKKIGPAGTSDYTNVGQHYLPLQIFNTTSGIYKNRKLEVGVLDNGTAVLQANAAGEGYFPIHLNPVAGGVLIGNGNTMTTPYTLQVGGTAYFAGTSSFANGLGIGTTTPSEQLHVVGNAKLEGGQIRFYTQGSDAGGSTGIVGNPNGWTRIDPNGGRFILTVPGNVANTGANVFDIERIDSWQHLMELRSDGGAYFNGSIGIKTYNPQASLDVAGNIKSFYGKIDNGGYWQGFYSPAPTGTWSINQNERAFFGLGGNVYSRGFSPNAMGIFNGSTTAEDVYLYNKNSPDGGFLVLKANNNVGIGIANPSEKLSVNGNIKAQKLIVTQSGWADYVFKPSYKLRSLNEVEQYIKTYQHLPDGTSGKC
jgi:hypothetical protein